MLSTGRNCSPAAATAVTLTSPTIPVANSMLQPCGFRRIALPSQTVGSLHRHRASIAWGCEPVQFTKKGALRFQHNCHARAGMTVMLESQKKGPRAARLPEQTKGATRLRAGLWPDP